MFVGIFRLITVHNVALLGTQIHLHDGIDISVRLSQDSQSWLDAEAVALVTFPKVRKISEAIYGAQLHKIGKKSQKIMADSTQNGMPRDDHHHHHHLAADLWTSVVFLRLKGSKERFSCEKLLSALPLVIADCVVGSDVFLLSSPYGLEAPHVLLNTRTKGIVSNILPISMHPRTINSTSSDVALYVTDAPVLPGSYGGVVVDARDLAAPLGMLLPTIRLGPVSDMGLSFILPFAYIKHALEISSGDITCSITSQTALPSPTQPRATAMAADNISRYVVSVTCGLNYGTGIVVRSDARECLLLTNAHVVHNHHMHGVQVWLSAAVVVAATVIWAPVEEFPDIALLRLNDTSNHTLIAEISSSTDHHLHAMNGEDVVLISFPVFHPSKNLPPSWTSGIVNVHATSPMGPVGMLTTTATTHPGSSGGLLLRKRDMSFIGIMTSVLEFRDRGRVQAHIRHGFAIPAPLLAPLWEALHVIDMNRTSQFNPAVMDQKMQLLPPSIKEMWALTPVRGEHQSKL